MMNSWVFKGFEETYASLGNVVVLLVKIFSKSTSLIAITSLRVYQIKSGFIKVKYYKALKTTSSHKD